jgi:excisionase family DNA binding protein
MTRLLTTTEAGHVLGVSRDSVLRLIRSGGLRVVDVSTGGRPRLRIRDDDLDAWIDAHTAPASTGENP